MKKKMIEAIMDAIENCKTVRLSFSIGDNAFTTHFIPDYIEVENNSVTIYSHDDIFVINTSNVSYEDVYPGYVCIEEITDGNNCYVLLEI